MEKENIKVLIKSIGLAVITFIFGIIAFSLGIGIVCGIVYLFSKHPHKTSMVIVVGIIIAIIACIAKNFYNDLMSEIFYIEYLQYKSVEKLNINITEKSVEPIHKQIKSQIIECIYVGDLKKGEPLPEIRSLVRDLMSKKTFGELPLELAYKKLETCLELVYKELVNDGIIYLVFGKYYIVKVKSAAVIKWLSQN